MRAALLVPLRLLSPKRGINEAALGLLVRVCLHVKAWGAMWGLLEPVGWQGADMSWISHAALQLIITHRGVFRSYL